MSTHTNTIKEKKLKYIRVYDRLYEMIQNRIYPPGSQLPSEKELAEQMDVSRMTLRKALALLQEDNLITNRSGIGSFVNEENAHAPSSGMETIGHPVRKCCMETLDDVEIALRIEPPTGAITKMLFQKSAAVVIVDRWYRHGSTPCAYSLSFVPVEVISREGIDLNHPESLLDFLEEGIYARRITTECKLSHSSAGNFTAAQYTISESSSFILIQETIRCESGSVLAASKHYVPIDRFKMELSLSK